LAELSRGRRFSGWLALHSLAGCRVPPASIILVLSITSLFEESNVR